MSATAVRPTDEQVKAYAEKLPEIYRQFMATFADADTERRFGESLHRTTIYASLSRRFDIRSTDVEDVAEKLESIGAVTVFTDPNDEFFSAAPTELGERLTTAITGIVPKPGLPDLPAPDWR